MPSEPDRPIKRAAGCVAYRFDESGAPLILLIHDRYGSWSLPKGHLKDGESEADAAAREVLEETGVTGQVGQLVDRIGYTVRIKKGDLRAKQVAFFLMRAADTVATPQADEGISAAGWFAPGEALARIGYQQVRDLLAQALQMLAERPA